MIIKVSTDTHPYDIVLENGALSRISEYLDLKRKVLVVTDSGVPSKYAETVAKNSLVPVTVTIPSGENSKNIDTFSRLLSVMLENGFTRHDCVVAVGGGVVGDIGGFAAATYMRGIDYYSIPTTLLSQVDSSIGGKTAIDFGGVKNSVGAFYQPAKVVIDPSALRTLPERHIHAGLAESVKMAAICDSELFSLIENSANLRDDLPEIILRSLLIKKEIVEKDPRENGLRRVLNFGHTVGHAVESLSCNNNADAPMLHGECVAVGMLPMCSADVREKIEKVLMKYSLPTAIPFSADEMMPYILHDKKTESDIIKTVRVDKIGTYVFSDMTADDIRSLLCRQYHGRDCR